MTTVVSGFSPAGRTEYGDKFLASFDRHWPEDIGLKVYVESEAFPAGRAQLRSLWLCDGVKGFIERHRTIPERNGRAPRNGWKEKERAAGYSFRFDAVRFCRQGFIPWHASQSLPDGEILAWLDADVLTLKPVPEGIIDAMVGENDLVYLGRGERHSELGFWAVRLSPQTRGMLRAFNNTYAQDCVFGFREWHSAFVFDECRAALMANVGRVHYLTPGGRGHVWFGSPETFPLGLYTDHLKGRRKALGRSPERPT